MPKDFDDGYEAVDRTETFTIAGEEFTTLSDLPGDALVDLMRMQMGGEVATIVGLREFIDACIIEEDRPRFAAIAGTPRVNVERLAAVSNWLTEHFSDRPTSRPTRSPGGPLKSGATSPRSGGSKGGKKRAASPSQS